MREIVLHLLITGMALLFSAALFFAAYRFGYFVELKSRRGKSGWIALFASFGIFLSIQLFFIPIALGGIQRLFSDFPLDTRLKGWVNLASIFAVGFAVYAYYFCRKKQLSWFSSEGALKSVSLGIFSWILAFPMIVAITQLLTVVLSDWFGFDLTEQLAVRQVKSVLPYPFLLTATVLTVVVVVPMIEELLFRGFLQEALISWMKPWRAIVVTSVVFALFHFSISQGINNLLILSSLFLLSCMLGFLKERQGSLWAPVGLHATFNAISLVQILAMQ